MYVACADARGVRVERLTLRGDRARIRELASLRALDMIRRAAIAADERQEAKPRKEKDNGIR